MRRKKTVALLICMVIAITGGLGYYNDLHASGLTYNQYLSNYYSEDSTLNFYLEECNTPYRTYVESGGNNFESTLAAWEVGTLGASAATTYTTKQVEFYKLILFDILYQDVSNSTFLKDYEKNIKALNVSCWKNLAELDSTISKSTKVDDALLDKLNNLKVFTKSMKYVSTFTKGLGYVNDAGDLINRICKIEALMNLPNECGEVLTSIMCNTDNLALQYALNEMVEACGGIFTEEQIAAWFTADAAISSATEECFKGLWDGLLASCGAAGLSIKVGQSVGKLGSNILVGTDKIAEEWYSMKMICDFEDALKKTVEGYQSRYKSNSTDENAVLFNESVRMLYKTMDMGMDYAKDFVKAVRSGGVVNWLYSFFNQTKYDELEKTLGNIQENMNSEILFVSNYMMNLYLDEYGSSVSANTDVSQEKQEITQEERETIVQQLSEDMIKTSNIVITKNTILTGDWETYGDLEVRSGTLDLNGFTLTVGGNVNQPGGYVKVNGGTLNIDGAYNLYKETVDSTDQPVKIHGGTLKMNNTADVVNVKGDFVTYAYNDSGYRLTAGTLNIYGDFEHLGVSSNGSFVPGDDLCINFLKEGTTKVSFVSTFGCLNSNTHFASKKVELSGKITGWKLTDDLTVEGEMPAFTGTFDLNGHTLNINGDFNQPDGYVKVNGGTLNIDGAYNLYKETVSSATGQPEKIYGGTLQMNNTEDVVNVKGDFVTYAYEPSVAPLTAGTLNIYGDFKHLYNRSGSSYSFRPGEKLCINFLKEGTTKVSFASTNSRLNDNTHFVSKKVELSGKITGWKLTDNLTIEGEVPAFTGTFDLNGHTLNINGDFNQPDGYVKVNGGTLNIDGAYNLYEEIVDSATGQPKKIVGGTLQMNNTADVVNVKGDFVTYAYNYADNPLTAGTLNIYGDFKHLGDYDNSLSSAGFRPGNDLCINFLKEGITKVSFASTYSYLNSNTHFASKKVELSGKITGWKLTDDLTIEGEVPAFTGTFDLNGHTLNINGDFNQPDGYVKVNGGTLNIDGAYNLYEEIVDSATGQPKKIGGGTLQMNNTADVVNVKGDFVTYGYNRTSPLTAGTLNLYGNFEQIGDSGYFSSDGSFEPGEELCINFLKEGTTKVSFVSTKSHLNNNTHFASKKVELSGKITGWKLTDDLTVEGAMPAFAGTFDLDGHTLNINGDFNQPSGTMKLNKGTLKVNGNYNLCGTKINSITDETEIVRGGSLLMQNVKEIVNVTGNMIVYSSNSSDSLVGGTLYLKGNFTQYGDSYSFRASQYHKTVLTGDATPENKQKITFNHSSCKFHILQLSKMKDCYEFCPEICWDELSEISGKSIVDAKVELEEESYLYEGKAVCPKVIVTLDGEQLMDDIDFVVSYEGNDKPGTAKIKVEGINCYEGVTEKEFTIVCEHKWGEWIVTKEATDTEEGQKEHICQMCGEIEKEVIPILGKQAQVIEGTDHYIKTYGDSNFGLDCILTKGNGVLSYTSDNEKVVSVDVKGNVCILGAGTASITVTASGTDEYVKTEKVITVTVNKAEQKFNITYNTDVLSVGQTLSIKAESSTGLITYESSDVMIANVDNQGVITAKAKGIVQIMVKSSGNDNYQEAVKSISITVKERELINPPEEPSFIDVQEGAWYYEYVHYNFMAGIMTGKDATHFAPDENLARAQFAIILYRMNGEPTVTYMGVFPDVSDGVWYTNAILWANNIGVVTGYSSTGCFGPADNINREQMAVMMYRYAKYMDYDVSQKTDFSKFTDASSVSGFADEAMQWAVGNKIITGKDNGTRLDPQGNASRAECATIIMRFVEKYE